MIYATHLLRFSVTGVRMPRHLRTSAVGSVTEALLGGDQSFPRFTREGCVL